MEFQIFQAVYFTRISSLWYFAFESIPLYAEEISMEAGYEDDLGPPEGN